MIMNKMIIWIKFAHQLKYWSSAVKLWPTVDKLNQFKVLSENVNLWSWDWNIQYELSLLIHWIMLQAMWSSCGWCWDQHIHPHEGLEFHPSLDSLGSEVEPRNNRTGEWKIGTWMKWQSLKNESGISYA